MAELVLVLARSAPSNLPSETKGRSRHPRARAGTLARCLRVNGALKTGWRHVDKGYDVENAAAGYGFLLGGAAF